MYTPPVGPGTILHTADGGKTWVDQSSNAGYTTDYEGLSFVSRNEGWIAASDPYGPGPSLGGKIIHTKNHGQTWDSQALPNAPAQSSPANVADVYFVDSMNGWAVDDFGQILHTSNGGAAGPGGWSVQFTSTHRDPSGVQYVLEAVAFYNKWRGVAVGEHGMIYRTTDGGVTWTEIFGALPPNGSGQGYEPTLTDVTFPKANVVAISGEGVSEGRQSTVLISRNGGASFKRQKTNHPATLNSISFPKGDDDGWVSGAQGTVLSNETNPGAGR